MSCYFPLNAFKAKSKDSDKIVITFSRPKSWRGEALRLPCGQCIGCRRERSRQWAVRCMHEASLYESNSFVTLTYDDKNLPPDRGLVLSDFQNFMKRLRKEVSPKRVRFYHCGEYGDINARPHYHTLLFNHDFSDKKFFSSKGENRLYTSEALSSLWDKGFSTVGDVTFESAAYVAGYILKKVTGVGAEKYYQGRRHPYTTMSRRPGIGKGWYEKFKADVYPLDRVVVRGRDTRPPRFYDSLLGREDRSQLELIKIDREFKNSHYVTDTLSNGRVVRESDSSDRRLAIKEVVKQAEISEYKRSL